MEGINESLLTGYPNVISYESVLKIINQMEKVICKIKIGNEVGTGFFCKIPCLNKNNMQLVSITNNHVINEELLYKDNQKISFKIKEDNEFKIINLNNRMK